MGVKSIHSIIFVFLAAITANMAHVVIAHEDEACEICLHINSSDDSLATTAQVKLPTHDGQSSVQDNWTNGQLTSHHVVADPIRGPPQSI